VSQEISIRFDAAANGRLMRELRGFDRTLYTRTRARIRARVRPVLDDVKAEILKGGPSRTGMRAGLAAGTRASISTGKQANVTIVTSPSKLPANKAAMARTWNKETFRHPLFGDRWHWYSQAGHEFFLPTILKHRLAFQQAYLSALQDAIREIERAS
jgi:hypothetical protein